MSVIFPNDFTAGTPDADDSWLVSVDGAARKVSGTVAKTFMLPEGVTDVAMHSELTETVLASADTTTGWTAVNSQSVMTTNTGTGTETRTEGTACIRYTPSMTNGSTSTKVYYTFASPQSTTGRSFIGLDIAWGIDGGFAARPDLFLVKVADDVALTGNVNTAIIPFVPLQTWQTITVSLAGLTEIKSVGIERLTVENYSGSASARNIIWIDNVRFPAESRIDQALHSADSVGVVVGGTYTHLATQVTPQIELGKSVLDFQQGSFSGFNRTIWLDSYYVDPTGATDVTERFSQVVNSAPAYSTVKAPSGALYRFDSLLTFSNLEYVTVDLSEATCFITWEIDQDFITIDSCSHVKVVVGQMFGFHDVTQTANAMSSLAGTPTLNGTSYELNALDEAIKSSSDTVRTWPMARTLNQQIGLGGTDIPRWNWKISAKDTNQVAGDLIMYVYNSVTLEVLATETYTATSSFADYWLQYDPIDLHVLPLLAVKKGTATANTLTVASHSRYGRVNYDAAYDSASCFALQFSEHITICGPDGGWGVIEGFGADMVQVSEPNVHFVELRNLISNGCRRQGFSINSGTHFLVEHCQVINSGRSGVDLEPYTEDALVDHITLRDVEIWNSRNYSIAFTNWTNLTNLDMDNVRSFNPGIGFCTGGSRGGTYKGLKSFRTDGNDPFGYVMEFYGIDLTIDGVYTDGYVACYTDSDTYAGDTYTCANNKATNLNFVGSTGITGGFRVRSTGDGWAFGEIRYSATQEANFTVGNPISRGGIGLNFPDTINWTSWQPAETGRQLGGTFKGNAFKSVWIPGGFNHLDEPVYRVRSLSGGTTRGNNLRGVNVTVTEAASTKAITFPNQQPGTFTTLPGTFSWTGAGSLVAGTTYYYRIAPRRRVQGPGTYCTQLTRLMASGQTRSLILLNVAVDHTNDILHEGWTVLRGTTNGGPYTHRADMVPTSQLWGHRGEAVELFDSGTDLTFNLTTPSSALFGYPQSVAFSTGSWTGAVDESGYEPDATYGVIVTPNWLTTVQVTAKTTAGFTINFGTPAPSNAAVDWFLVR